MRYRYRYLGGLALAVLLIAGGVFLFRPRALPPPSAEVPSAATSPSGGGWPRSFTDDLGATVTLTRPARRVVTLSPNLAEILCAVGASGQLVGVDAYTKYPPVAAAKPKVGGIINPDFEAILALNPDLVLVSRGLDLTLVERLRSFGFPVMAFDPRSLDEVIALVERLGTITGRDREAGVLAEDLRTKRQAVEASVQEAGGPQLRVLVVIGWEGLFVAGAGTFVDDLVTTSGAVNAVRSVPKLDLSKPFPQLTREQVALANPQILIFAGPDAVPSGTHPRVVKAHLKTDPVWSRTPAVRKDNVAVMEADLLTVPGPRLFDALLQVRAAVQRALIPPERR